MLDTFSVSEGCTVGCLRDTFAADTQIASLVQQHRLKELHKANAQGRRDAKDDMEGFLLSKRVPAFRAVGV